MAKKKSVKRTKNNKYKAGGESSVYYVNMNQAGGQVPPGSDPDINNWASTNTDPTPTYDQTLSPEQKQQEDLQKMAQQQGPQFQGLKTQTDTQNSTTKQQRNANGIFLPGFNKNYSESPEFKGVNEAVTAVTSIGDAIQNGKLKRQEQLKVIESMTPKYMQNMEGAGLHNVPAYTQYGGSGGSNAYNRERELESYNTQVEIDAREKKKHKLIQHKHPVPSHRYGGQPAEGSPVGVVDFDSGSGIEDGMYDGFGRRDSFYGHGSIYKTGGTVSSAKAKEILRDGTAQGHPLTDKQKRYFGWIAGGKKQVGGRTDSAFNPIPGVPVQQKAVVDSLNPKEQEDYYNQNATLQHYKEIANQALQKKNPEAYNKFIGGFQDPSNRIGAGREKYVEGADYQEYLSPEELKKTFGKGYGQYESSIKAVNAYDTRLGRNPLYGSKENPNEDPTNLKYGKKFASIPADTHRSFQGTTTGYQFNPKTGKVDVSSSSDQTVNKQTGGYAVGDEVELSAAEIRDLKKQGYKIENI